MQHTLRNDNGMLAVVLEYGATLQSLTAPDRNGVWDDIVLGYDTVDEYRDGSACFGATVGRYANRIANGRFEYAGTAYQLEINSGRHHLHGGTCGFDKRIWEVQSTSRTHVKMCLTSPAGEAGYPGKLIASVTYTLDQSNQLRVDYHAVSTQATPVNLTNHSYFNLAGQGNGDVLDHQLTLKSNQFTPVDSELIPTGEIRSVDDSPMDFRSPTRIGARINSDDPQTRYGQGYDHNWVVERESKRLTLAAAVLEPGTGRILETYTTEPGVQFYTGNHIRPNTHGKDGRSYGPRSGFCLETQGFPDSPNKRMFPSTILQPGETYESTTIFSLKVGH